MCVCLCQVRFFSCLLLVLLEYFICFCIATQMHLYQLTSKMFFCLLTIFCIMLNPYVELSTALQIEPLRAMVHLLHRFFIVPNQKSLHLFCSPRRHRSSSFMGETYCMTQSYCFHLLCLHSKLIIIVIVVYSASIYIFYIKVMQYNPITLLPGSRIMLLRIQNTPHRTALSNANSHKYFIYEVKVVKLFAFAFVWSQTHRPGKMVSLSLLCIGLQQYTRQPKIEQRCTPFRVRLSSFCSLCATLLYLFTYFLFYLAVRVHLGSSSILRTVFLFTFSPTKREKILMVLDNV